MAEEFQQAGLCGGGSYYWWNNTTSSPALGGFAWPAAGDTERSSCDEEEATGGAASGSDTCVVVGDVEKPEGLLLDSTLQMMGFGLSSSDHWNQPNHLLRSSGGGGEGEGNYNSVLLQDMNTSISSGHHQIQRDWTSPPKSFSSEEDDHSPNSNQDLDNTFLNTSAADHTNNYSGLQTLLFEEQPALFGNMGTRRSLNEPFLQQQEAAAGHDSSLHLSNNTPFWNALSHNNTNTLFSPKEQFLTPSFEHKPDHCSALFASKAKSQQVRDSAAVVKRGNSTSDQQEFKRPRMETPSPLPTFKVRKEKLGDRITALQQLVSPFGKTDTASVLHEAIEYIKFLHDQVNVLSTPYMKNGALQHQQACGDHNTILSAGGEGKQDLRKRGLCLVPISSTFPVANETTADFWTPTFGASLK